MLSAMEVGFQCKDTHSLLLIVALISYHSSFGGLSIKHDFHAILQQNPSWNCWRALPPDQLLSSQKLLKSRHLRALVSASHSCSVQLNGKGYHFAACVLCNFKKQIIDVTPFYGVQKQISSKFFKNSLSPYKEQLPVSLHT